MVFIIRDFNFWCEENDIAEDVIREIEYIRKSEPSRRVKSRVKNVSGFYPSSKMGITIQFESRTVELAAIYEKEHDINILEYYDQPPSFPIKYKIKDKVHGHLYTPDFFVISEEWIGWEEWKTEEDLLKLSEKQPYRYCLNERGQWSSPPVEVYAKERGLSFRIRLSKEIDWVYQRNIRFLEDYLLNQPTISTLSKTTLQTIVKSSPGIKINELLNNTENYSTDDLYTLIARGDLYIDLYDKSIPQYDLVKVFIDKSTAEAYQNIHTNNIDKVNKPLTLNIEVGSNVQWDGREWKILNIGEFKISLLATDKIIEIPKETFKDLVMGGKILGIKEQEIENHGEALEILKTADKFELQEANKKYDFIMKLLNGESFDSIPVPNRTLRYWLKNYSDAEKKFGNGYIGLITKRQHKGNKKKRHPNEIVELMNNYIEVYYKSKTQKTKTVVYNDFAMKCKEKGYICPSYKTFCLKIKNNYTEYEIIKSRKGRKASYSVEPFYWYMETTTPRHGDRPFEIAHIDHTQLDIELVCSITGKVLGRPWATFMVDAYSRRILAAYLSYDNPSYRTEMMIMRECVKRFGRLPKILVVDGGKDFQSIYFETFLANYKVQKQVRPASKARFGSVCERLFGTTNKSFIHNLIGNTQIMTNVRQVSKDVNPKSQAIWTLPLFAEYLFKWVYEIYDTLDHSSLGESPRDAYLKGVANAGERAFTLIGNEELFKMLSLPTTRKGTAKVQPGRGIKINNINYWSNILYDPSVEKKQVEVRYDPYNMGIAYAYINKRWIELKSEYYLEIANRSEKELQIAFEEIRRRQRIQRKRITVTASKLVEFLRSAHEIEKLQIQRLKDQEFKAVLTVMEGGKNTKPEKKESIDPIKTETKAKLPTIKPSQTASVSTERIVYEEF